MLFQNFYENRRGHVGKLYYSLETVEPIDLEKSLKSLPESAVQVREYGQEWNKVGIEWILTNRHNELFIIESNCYAISITSYYSRDN